MHKIQCESFLNYLLSKNLVFCVKRLLEQEDMAYIHCPESPFQKLTVDTTPMFIKFLEELREHGNFQIIMNLKVEDYQSLLGLPD